MTTEIDTSSIKTADSGNIEPEEKDENILSSPSIDISPSSFPKLDENEIKRAGFSLGFAEDRNKKYRRTMEVNYETKLSLTELN